MPLVRRSIAGHPSGDDGARPRPHAALALPRRSSTPTPCRRQKVDRVRYGGEFVPHPEVSGESTHCRRWADIGRSV